MEKVHRRKRMRWHKDWNRDMDPADWFEKLVGEYEALEKICKARMARWEQLDRAMGERKK